MKKLSTVIFLLYASFSFAQKSAVRGVNIAECCRDGSWISKTIDWSIIKTTPRNLTANTNKSKMIKPGYDGDVIGTSQPLSSSINISKCDSVYHLGQNGTYTFNAGYQCSAAKGQNCSKIIKVKIRGSNNNSLDGLYNAPVTKTFTSAGNYQITYYAYCGDKICDSCKFIVAIDKNCCAGSKWISASYQVVNKKLNGDWEYVPGFLPLPLLTGSSIPVYKADVALNISLNYQCAQGCTAGYIVRRKNITTGAEEVPETLPQPGTSVYAKPWPQLITITPTCGGQPCSDPLIFKVECLNKNCIPTADSTVNTIDCANQLIRNGDFTGNIITGTMPAGSVQYWSKAYGNPYLNNTPGAGCFDDGLVKLSGNNTNGDAIMQTLSTTNQVIAGKKYKVSMAVRFKSDQNTLDYGKIRVIAFNGTLPTTGLHPAPAANLAIIGRSSKIKDCNDWSVIEFSVWKANKNFEKIAINAFTNDNTISTILIDNVTICEVLASDCEEVTLDANGNPITPAGYGVVPAGFNCQPEAEEEEYYNGSLTDLYGYNGTFSMYETLNQDDCTTIGGTLPGEVTNYNCDDSLRAYGINMNCDSLENLINSQLSDFGDTVFIPSPIQPLNTFPAVCTDRSINRVQSNTNMAFRGRDIIFIHGLQLKHLIDKGLLDPRAMKDWPVNRSEFYGGGYYKLVAEDNWKAHIEKFITGPNGVKNRYLIVSYNCSERADIAIYNVMEQIREAMENGTGVMVPDNTDPRGNRCFGKDYVIVSHSTGGLIADLVLSVSRESKTNMFTRALYGDVGYIADRCKGHIAMHGAMGGSNLAKIVAASGLPIVMHSILVDLTPTYTYLRWGLNLNKVPVPVFTVAGGHPAAQLGAAITVIAPSIGPLASAIVPQIIPGVDDGVVNMESASGRNQPPGSPISQFATLFPVKAFDMGIKKDRAIGFFIDQLRSGNTFSITSSPYLTQNGMVEPALSIPVMHPQLTNHYTFIQSPSEHLQPGNVSYYSTCNYWNTLLGSANNEEVLVTNDASLYTSGLIDPAIISKMGESVKDKHIPYPVIRIIYKKGIPRPTIFWKKFYIWKRTYHTLNDNCWYDMDYAYKYLFVN